MLLAALPVMAQQEPICGEPAVFTLWGGKTINVGNVTVSNTETKLIVTYNTTGEWKLKEVHLYVLNYEPTERLTPGQAPYKSGDISYATTYTFVVPLGDVECGTTLWLQAHASVVMLDEYGNEYGGETAYGGEINPNASPWYGNIAYTVQCCEDEEPCYAFIDETAWAAGSRYVAKGNWATYTSFEGTAKTVDLFAGQTIDVGDVTFTPDNGNVIITITLTDGWLLKDYVEPVKIQGYDVAPSGNPSPGLFTTYKGTALEVTVPAFAFYGVHVDVGYWVEVECPVE